MENRVPSYSWLLTHAQLSELGRSSDNAVNWRARIGLLPAPRTAAGVTELGGPYKGASLTPPSGGRIPELMSF